MKLPTIKLWDKGISRLILGGNQISGFSHISKELDKEMVDFYTTEKIKLLFDECLRNGINTVQTRGDRHIMRILNEYRNDGKNIQWIAQTASEFTDIKSNIKQIASSGAIAVYHHGTHVDNLWHSGEKGIIEIEEYLKAMRDTGLLVGLGTHQPEVIAYAEEKEWDVDFYMTSFYNLAKKHKSVQATDGFQEEEFDNSDIELMVKEVRLTKKPCFVFKILGAGRKAGDFQSLEESFKYAFGNIKSNDCVVVGMFQKYKNQVLENSEIVRKILA